MKNRIIHIHTKEDELTCPECGELFGFRGAAYWCDQCQLAMSYNNNDILQELPTELYRYHVHEFNSKVSLHLDTYQIMRYTPSGYWIALNHGGWNMYQSYEIYCSKSWTKKKWVNLHAGIKFAWESKERALFHLKKRQEKYKQILMNRLNRCMTGLQVVGEQIEVGPEHPVTHPMGRDIEEALGDKKLTLEG